MCPWMKRIRSSPTRREICRPLLALATIDMFQSKRHNGIIGHGTELLLALSVTLYISTNPIDNDTQLTSRSNPASNESHAQTSAPPPILCPPLPIDIPPSSDPLGPHTSSEPLKTITIIRLQSSHAPTDPHRLPHPPLPCRAPVQPHCRHRRLPRIHPPLHLELHNLPLRPGHLPQEEMAPHRRPPDRLRSVRRVVP